MSNHGFVSMLLHWLNFSVRCEPQYDEYGFHSSGPEDVRRICEEILRIPFGCFRLEQHGKYCYRMTYIYEGIRIYYDGHQLGMGCLVSMSGNACHVYETHHTMMSLVRRIVKLHIEGKVNITKVDAAADDRSGILNMRVIRDATEDRHFRSTLAFINACGSQKSRKARFGRAVYVGSRYAEKSICVYDKAVEQEVEGHWIRVEIRLRNDHASGFLQLLVEHDYEPGAILAKIIMDTIQYIELTDSNISRCDVSDWWSRFLGTLDRVKIMLKEKPKMSMDRSKRFLLDQASASLYTCVKAYGSQFVRTLFETGEKRFSKRHEVMLADFKSSKYSLDDYKITHAAGQLCLPPGDVTEYIDGLIDAQLLRV